MHGSRQSPVAGCFAVNISVQNVLAQFEGANVLLWQVSSLARALLDGRFLNRPIY